VRNLYICFIGKMIKRLKVLDIEWYQRVVIK
jgi:hypothetical protein